MLVEGIATAVMHGLRNIDGAAPKFFIDQKRSFFLMEQNFDLEGPKIPTKFSKEIGDFQALESFEKFIAGSKSKRKRKRRHNR